MGYEISHICQVETRRCIWLVGVVFAMVLIVQYLELPYGNVISSVFSDGKAQVPVSGSSPSSDLSHKTNNLNSTGTIFANEMANKTKISEEKDIAWENDSVSGKNESLDEFSELDPEDDPNREASSVNVELNHNSTVEKIKRNDGLAPDKATEFVDSFTADNITTDSNSSLSNNPEENIAPTSQVNGNPDASPAMPSFALPQIGPPPPLASLTNVNTSTRAPIISSNDPNTSSVEKIEPKMVHYNEKLGPLQSDGDLSGGNPSIPNATPVAERPKSPTAAVVLISEMNDMFLMSRASSYSMKPRWSSAVDQQLLDAKSQIENAPIIRNDRGLYAPLYWNISMFRRSYELMEQTLKVYIYKEGKRPVFHQPVLKGIYASEGWFMKLLKANKQFVTKNPRKAHLFYLPFSSRKLEETLYVPDSHSRKNLIAYLENYLDLIIAKYPFWNRTGGADHFLAACHDWAPAETELRMTNCIRALCNADMEEGFKLGKDVSLPETNVRATQNLLKDVGGNDPSQRPILAFFAGKMHGYLRPILLQYWENKDPDIKIFKKLPKSKNNRNYVQYMKTSKYCICAKGYEVNSPRVVEAIFFECVPVIISDNFVPPFFEILNWESFAVFIQEKDLLNLKNILVSITDRRYRVMQQRVKQVQQHFLWHAKPVKYDIFHMILHSIWYNRVFQVISS